MLLFLSTLDCIPMPVHTIRTCICRGSILSFVQIYYFLFFVFGDNNVIKLKQREIRFLTNDKIEPQNVHTVWQMCRSGL